MIRRLVILSILAALQIREHRPLCVTIERHLTLTRRRRRLPTIARR